MVICHPKLAETGLDLLDFPTIIFYEMGVLAAHAEAGQPKVLAYRPEATGTG